MRTARSSNFDLIYGYQTSPGFVEKLFKETVDNFGESDPTSLRLLD